MLFIIAKYSICMCCFPEQRTSHIHSQNSELGSLETLAVPQNVMLTRTDQHLFKGEGGGHGTRKKYRNASIRKKS